MNNQEIKLVQLPVIQHNLQIIGKGVSKRILALNLENQVATEDTIKTLKEIRAELSKEATAFETQRKDVKNAVMQPYSDFEAIYKTEIIDKYKDADELLKKKISEFEMKIKIEKREKLVGYFNGLCESRNIDFLTFERMNLEVNLSTSEKKYQEQILEFVSRVNDDLKLIETETENAAEILIEYKKTLNASGAITTVRARKDAEKAERLRIIANRTSARIKGLQGLSFVYDDLTKIYHFVSDANIFIKYFDVETLENDEWSNLFVKTENLVKDYQKSQKQHISASVVQTTAQPASQPTAETKEEIFVATFEVTGTHAKIMMLKNFLVENNFNYKNL